MGTTHAATLTLRPMENQKQTHPLSSPLTEHRSQIPLSFVRALADPALMQNVESYHIVVCEPSANNLLMTPGHRLPRAPTHFVAGKPSRTRRPQSMKERLARIDTSTMLPVDDHLSMCRWKKISARVDGDYARDGKVRAVKEKLTSPSIGWHFEERQASLQRMAGPLDVYTLGLWRLSRISAERPLDSSWLRAAEYKKKKTDWLVVVHTCCGLIPKPLDRSRAKASVARDARCAGLALGRKFCIAATAEKWAPCVRVWLRKVASRVRIVLPHWAAYILENTLVVNATSRQWKQELVNVQCSIRNFVFDAAPLSDEEIVKYDLGQDMIRIPFDSKLRVVVSDEELAASQVQITDEWLGCCGVAKPYAQVPFDFSFASDEGRMVSTKHSDIAEKAFTICKQLLEEGTTTNHHPTTAHHPSPTSATTIPQIPTTNHHQWCCTIADKDPSILWMAHMRGYMHRWCGRLQNQSRWEVVSLNEKTVLNFYRSLVNTCLPRTMLPQVMAMEAQHLPYAYASIKEKCFKGDRISEKGMHTCREPRHSCERNIISSIRLPGRKSFRKIGRGLRHLLNVYGKGWCYTDLTGSAADLKLRFYATRKRASSKRCLCLACKNEMLHPGFVAGDAGQAYEELDPDFVAESLNHFYSLAGFSSDPKRDATISVYNSIAHHARSGGVVVDLVEDRTVFWISRLRKCVAALLAMKIYKLGSKFLVQVRGVPIGGPISGVVLEICLTRLEQAFASKWRDFTLAHVFTGKMAQYIAAGRYADDTVFLSRWFCSSCLEQLMGQVYSSQIKFNTAQEAVHLGGGFIHVKILDFCMFCSCETFSVTVDSSNEAFAWFRAEGVTKKKTRFPICHGQKYLLCKRLLRDLQGRIARLRQLELCHFDTFYAILVDVVELIRSDFPFCIVLEAWKQIPLQDNYYKDGLRGILHVGKHIAAARNPCPKDTSGSAAISAQVPHQLRLVDRLQPLCKHRHLSAIMGKGGAGKGGANKGDQTNQHYQQWSYGGGGGGGGYGGHKGGGYGGGAGGDQVSALANRVQGIARDGGAIMSLLSMAQHFGGFSSAPAAGQGPNQAATSMNPFGFLMGQPSGAQQQQNLFGQPQIQILQPPTNNVVAKNSALEDALVAAVKEGSKDASQDEALRIQGLAKRIGAVAEQVVPKTEPTTTIAMDSFDTQLENSAPFKKLRQEVGATNDSVQQLLRTVAESNQDTQTSLKNIIEMLGSQSSGINRGVLIPPRVATPRVKREEAPRGPCAVVNVIDFSDEEATCESVRTMLSVLVPNPANVWSQRVSNPLHTFICKAIITAPDNAKFGRPIHSTIRQAGGQLDLKSWWNEIAKCKTRPQWRTQLSSWDFPPALVELLSEYDEIGLAIIAFLIRRGKLQTIYGAGIEQAIESDDSVPAWSSA